MTSRTSKQLTKGGPPKTSSNPNRYSTFSRESTFDVQSQRLAALNPTKTLDDVEEDTYRKSRRGRLKARIASCSEGCSEFWRDCAYKTMTACMPCYEIASALNLCGLFSSKDINEDEELLKEKEESHQDESGKGIVNGGHKDEDTTIKESPKLNKLKTGLISSSSSSSQQPSPGHHRKASLEVSSQMPKPKLHHPIRALGLKGRVASEMVIRPKPSVLMGIKESPSKDEVKESGSGGGMSSGIGMVAAGMAGAVMAPACAMVKDGEGRSSSLTSVAQAAMNFPSSNSQNQNQNNQSNPDSLNGSPSNSRNPSKKRLI